MGRWKYVAVPAVIVGLLFAYEFYTAPAAIRAFRRHRSLLEQAAQNPPAFEADDRSQPITDPTLRSAGFIAVRRRGTCLCFYHQGFMAAIDSWREILYSPGGKSGLPAFRIGERNTLSHLEEVGDDGRWYYVVHD